MLLANYLVKEGKGIANLINIKPVPENIEYSKFSACLRAIKYAPKDLEKLLEGLTAPGKSGSKMVSIKILKDALKAAENKSKPTVEGVRSRISKFDKKVQNYLQKISDFLKREGMSVSDLHSKLDIDGDGGVDNREFLSRMSGFNIPGLIPADINLIFNSLDINDDNSLSVSELSMFLEGA